MAISASFVLFVLVVIVLFLLIGRRKLMAFAYAPIKLNYDNVVRATGNFSIRNLIGTRGFGSTYKEELVPGFLVAVKRLSIEEVEMFLIYNYLSGGNLETFIHERSDNNVEWSVIHKIAIDMAHALPFLHYSWLSRIVHHDIKPSNILLYEEFNAYLFDFRLAQLLEVFETYATTIVASTFGILKCETQLNAPTWSIAENRTFASLTGTCNVTHTHGAFSTEHHGLVVLHTT
ncbi:hypothetical protein ACSBR1_022759 [Camellia fascicularis]